MTTKTPAARAVMDPAEPLVNRNGPAPHAKVREALSWNLLHPIRSLLRPRIEGDLLGKKMFLLTFRGALATELASLGWIVFVSPFCFNRLHGFIPWLGRYIVSTARKRALPSTTRWYAFGASASG